MSDYKEIDDQASLCAMIMKANPELMKEESKDGKPLMSHSFMIIDFSKAGKKK